MAFSARTADETSSSSLLPLSPSCLLSNFQKLTSGFLKIWSELQSGNNTTNRGRCLQELLDEIYQFFRSDLGFY